MTCTHHARISIYTDDSVAVPCSHKRTFPDWKAKELRRAYWASLSYTDSNIGRVLTALDESPFAKETVIALWGDHGYALGGKHFHSTLTIPGQSFRADVDLFMFAQRCNVSQTMMKWVVQTMFTQLAY